MPLKARWSRNHRAFCVLFTCPDTPEYLCAECTEANRKETVRALMRTARERAGTIPPFSLALVMLTGILQWRYEIQVYLGK